MSGYRHPRMDDNELDLRTLSEKATADRPATGKSYACAARSCKNCRRSAVCSCDCHPVAGNPTVVDASGDC